MLTQHEAGDLDGRLRTFSTMAIVGVVALAGVATQGGFPCPRGDRLGRLLALTFLYGTAFTIMFTVLPKLGVVGNSAIMNIEPIFALVLAWAILGQTIAPIQVAGGLLVVATVIFLGRAGIERQRERAAGARRREPMRRRERRGRVCGDRLSRHLRSWRRG